MGIYFEFDFLNTIILKIIVKTSNLRLREEFYVRLWRCEVWSGGLKHKILSYLSTVVMDIVGINEIVSGYSLE